MIGQKRLLDKFNSYTFNSFPNSTILKGPKGCGKHTLIEYIANKWGVDTVDVSNKINLDTVTDIYTSPVSAIYIIDVDKIKRLDTAQNVILKLLEEPPQNCIIIIITETTDVLLNTVLNRCQIFQFEEYSAAELSNFALDNNIVVASDNLFVVYDTPGKLLNMSLNEQSYNELNLLSNKVISSIRKATIPNTLTISNKFDFTDYSVDTFLHLMRINLLSHISDLNTTVEEFNTLKSYYIETCLICSKFKTFNVNKKMLFENYLLTLKGVI